MKLFYVALKASQIGKEDLYSVDKISSKYLRNTATKLVEIMFQDKIDKIKEFSLEVTEIKEVE